MSYVVDEHDAVQTAEEADDDDMTFSQYTLTSWPHGLNDPGSVALRHANTRVTLRELLSLHVRALNQLHTGTIFGCLPAPVSSTWV